MTQEKQPSVSIPRRSFLAAGSVSGWLLLGGQRSVRADSAGKNSAWIVHTQTPRNAEPALDQLVQSWITPNERFYIRSHAPVPKIDTATFRLSIEGLVHRPLQISLQQLEQQFKSHEVVATMTCAGNRRSEHSLIKPVGGVPWQAGAIGNATWGGASLVDLLKKAGVKENARHVWFEGVDEIERSTGVIPFGASIPISKAMSTAGPAHGALVAYRMNGQPLPPDHGFPVRTVVPSYIGARSVKWLGKIIVSDRPSTNHYVATAYKLVTQGSEEEWAAAPPLGLFPINSVICHPASGVRIKPQPLDVRGYALATGEPGRTINKVEVSIDGGHNWSAARFTSPAKQYCWRLWTARIQPTSRTKEIVVRATDSAGHQQPQKVAWNLKGYMFNAWHRTPVEVDS